MGTGVIRCDLQGSVEITDINSVEAKGGHGVLKINPQVVAIEAGIGIHLEKLCCADAITPVVVGGASGHRFDDAAGLREGGIAGSRKGEQEGVVVEAAKLSKVSVPTPRSWARNAV